MKFSRLVMLLAISPFLTFGLPAARPKNEPQAAKQETVANQAAPLKERHIPLSPGPGTSVQGKVTLRIVVDAEGNVSEARALSGPEELVPSALAWVRKWQYEPPASAPVTKIVEISYGSRDCPGAISERGEMTWSWYLRDKDGKMIAVIDDVNPPQPLYPDEERKAGIAGKMVLSLTLNPDGHVKEIHVVNSLSPSLDKTMVDMVRPLKFKRCLSEPQCSDGNSNASLEDLRLEFVFRATCNF
jgi:TonB family protein